MGHERQLLLYFSLPITYKESGSLYQGVIHLYPVLTVTFLFDADVPHIRYNMPYIHDENKFTNQASLFLLLVSAFFTQSLENQRL